MTLEQFFDAMQKACGIDKHHRNKVDRVMVLALKSSHAANNIIDYDIKDVQFDENHGTIYIEVEV